MSAEMDPKMKNSETDLPARPRPTARVEMDEDDLNLVLLALNTQDDYCATKTCDHRYRIGALSSRLEVTLAHLRAPRCHHS